MFLSSVISICICITSYLYWCNHAAVIYPTLTVKSSFPVGPELVSWITLKKGAILQPPAHMFYHNGQGCCICMKAFSWLWGWMLLVNSSSVVLLSPHPGEMPPCLICAYVMAALCFAHLYFGQRTLLVCLLFNDAHSAECSLLGVYGSLGWRILLH